MKKYYGFAAFCVRTDQLLTSSCAPQAGAVRRYVGLLYEGKDAAAGWKLARKSGWRVKRVIVALTPEPGATRRNTCPSIEDAIARESQR